MVPPTQTGELLVGVGIDGRGFITTETLPARLGQAPCVMVTEYVPVLAAVALVMEGFCKVEVKEFGPVQL